MNHRSLRVRILPVALGLAVLTGGPATAHDTDAQTGVLGTVVFPTTCDARVQAAFNRAVAMLHSFWFNAGEQAFRDVLKADPQCAIAYWGIASLLMSNPLAGQGASAKGAEQARAALEEARRIGAKSERERDYIEAVGAYYKDFATRPERERQVARAQAYEALAAKYPTDDEAKIFSALYTAGTQLQSDQTYAAYLKSAAILEEQFRKYPDHPGVAHYLIHSYDAPPIAAKGVGAARKYATIAPTAPHALHMPSHIFTRVGEWEPSIETNRRSMEVASAGGDGDGAWHAVDYMVYAYLQLARDGDVRRLFQDVKYLPAPSQQFVAYYAMAAVPARYVAERGAWKEAAGLKPVGSSYPFVEAITVYTRSLGAARSGDLAAAKADAAQLDALHAKLVEAKNTYWANEVDIQRMGANAWIRFGEGDREQALKLMRAAADLEDHNEKHIVTPGRVIPARELLGDMLLEAKQPREALREYEASRQREPNRFRNYLGTAHAYDMAGDREQAAVYYRKVVTLAKDGDAERPDLAEARKVAAR